MSYDSYLDLFLDRKANSYVVILRSLLNHGWSLNNTGGGISYCLTDDNGQFNDLRTISFAEENAMWTDIQRMEALNQLFGVNISWPRTDIALITAWNNPANPKQIDFMTQFQRPMLPGCEPITNHNWYLENLVPAINYTENYVVGLRCHEE